MDRLNNLLERTSRTFALSIPLLPAPLCEEVQVAYLLFRVADTLEDTTLYDRRLKQEALRRFADWLVMPNPIELPELLPDPVSDNLADNELVASLDLLRERLDACPFNIRNRIIRSVVDSANGMRQFLGTGNESTLIDLKTRDDLRSYCYVVAGSVGELLSDLFVLRYPRLGDHATQLQSLSAAFGEGLQLVNILKDREVDRAAGRCFIPTSVSLEPLYDLARDDLLAAREYVSVLKRARAPDGVVCFCELPVQLAWQTLDLIQQHGPGTKISRSTVMEVLRVVTGATSF